ncbi:glycosyltransferase family 4 protein [Eubacterium limosum]|uniref:glycosyltransferase family 4 protein n=1 Tax=Eubacterium limosum TaxID=1736 RepID=UPI00106303BC|nr:glycosyltransferase family 4 protein [Eubacterium limosum]
MQNVLFIHSSSELYGSDRSLLNIIKYIDKSKFNVSVILPCHGPLVDEMKKIPNITIEIFEIAILRRKNLSFKGMIKYIKNFIVSIRFLKKYIIENKIEIVDTNTAVVFPGAIAARNTGVKSVWHIREIIKNSLENKVISFLMQNYADLIVANSIATGRAVNVSENKIRVVYNAVEEKSGLLLKTHNQLTIGMAGRINRWKGQKLLIDAAEKVHQKFPDAVFKIAGDTFKGEEKFKSDLQEYIKKKNLQDSVILLGQMDDMMDFYSSLDIFVLPSIQPEPFGLVIIEAMEFGIPVIATNHGGPKEIISNGINGYLVTYQDCTEMTDCIVKLLENPKLRSQIGINGKIKKREQFSIPTMVKRIEEIFYEALSI